MRTYKLAAIPGDGIGVEVIAAGLGVLSVLAKADRGFRLDEEHFAWSSDYDLEHGHYIPEGGLERPRQFDAIFFGAVGDTRVPGHAGQPQHTNPNTAHHEQNGAGRTDDRHFSNQEADARLDACGRGQRLGRLPRQDGAVHHSVHAGR